MPEQLEFAINATSTMELQTTSLSQLALTIDPVSTIGIALSGDAVLAFTVAGVSTVGMQVADPIEFTVGATSSIGFALLTDELTFEMGGVTTISFTLNTVQAGATTKTYVVPTEDEMPIGFFDVDGTKAEFVEDDENTWTIYYPWLEQRPKFIQQWQAVLNDTTSPIPPGGAPVLKMSFQESPKAAYEAAALDPTPYTMV